MMLPLRLRRVAGHEGRLNDALFQPAARAPPLGSQTIVYFGGDVQDYPEVMQLHREHRHYVKWNLENTARMLGHNFPTKHVLVVKSARVEYKSFSCYDNFVPGNNAGIPEHTPTHNALHHLEKLLQAVTTRLKELPTAELLEAVTSASLPEEIDIEDLHKSTVQTGQTGGAGSEQSEASGTSPRQGEASGTSPRQGEASGTSPRQGEASGTSPRQGEASGTSPRQGEASGTSPKQGETSGSSGQGEASGASPGQSEAKRASARKGEASGASSKEGVASRVSPKQGEASGASPQQGEASGASPKQGEASGASLGLNEASVPGQPEPEADPLWWRDKLALDESQLTLVGFSKGCVVLNQLIYEFHYTKTLTPGDAHMLKFMERIADMYWLDGGHAGGKNTWITSRSLLETLTRLNVNIFIHVSPYQVRDDGRPWIGREEKAFTRLLKKLGAKVNRYMHNKPGMSHTLNMHFEVLGGFKRLQDSLPVSMPDSSDEEQ